MSFLGVCELVCHDVRQWKTFLGVCMSLWFYDYAVTIFFLILYVYGQLCPWAMCMILITDFQTLIYILYEYSEWMNRCCCWFSIPWMRCHYCHSMVLGIGDNFWCIFEYSNNFCLTVLFSVALIYVSCFCIDLHIVTNCFHGVQYHWWCFSPNFHSYSVKITTFILFPFWKICISVLILFQF